MSKKKKKVIWPFSPELLDSMPEELAELFRELELTVLKEIADRLIISDQLNEVTAQQIRVLRSHGIQLSEITKAIEQTAKISEKKLNALLDDVVEMNQRYYTEVIDLAEVTKPETLVNDADIVAIRRQTWGAFQNITQSTGFLVSSSGRLEFLQPAKAYQHCLDSALLQVQSGAMSYGQAIARATRQLADSGLKTVYYEPKEESGNPHYDQVDVSIRRAVMTGVTQLNAQYAIQSIEYLSSDYVEVSAHYGARNIGTGPQNHESWQGQCYYFKERAKGPNKYRYKDFLSTTDYGGSGVGLCGYNCRHNFRVFLPDVMLPTYSQAELDDMKSENHVIEFEGEKYDRYASTQVQRSIERSIRKQKRRLAAATDDKTAQAARIKIRMLNEKYAQFSKAAGLQMQKERANVYVPKGEGT